MLTQALSQTVQFMPFNTTDHDCLSFLKQAFLLHFRRKPRRSSRKALLWSHMPFVHRWPLRQDFEVPALKFTVCIKFDIGIAVKPITSADWLFIGNYSGMCMLFVDLKAPAEMSHEAKPVKNLLLAPKKEK